MEPQRHHPRGRPASRARLFRGGRRRRQMVHLIVPTPTWSSRAVTPAEAGTFELREQADGQVLRYTDFIVGGERLELQVEVAILRPPGADEIRRKRDKKLMVDAAVYWRLTLRKLGARCSPGE